MDKRSSKSDSRFNENEEKRGIERQFHKEEDDNGKAFTKAESDLSLGDSIRNNADVNGTTFGMDSNTAKFSNVGKKNQARKEEDGIDSASEEDIDNLTKGNR